MTTFPEGEFLLPLFPLPNLVFFPRTRLPLHVFEPRYRKMITDAVAADQRFGIVLLRPGGGLLRRAAHSHLRDCRSDRAGGSARGRTLQHPRARRGAIPRRGRSVAGALPHRA